MLMRYMHEVHLNEKVWVVHPSCEKHAQVNKKAVGLYCNTSE
jgi:hypothetical protein